MNLDVMAEIFRKWTTILEGKVNTPGDYSVSVILSK
jgi:hypothetical protein